MLPQKIRMMGLGKNVVSISFCADRKGKVKERREEIVGDFNENRKAGE